MVRKVFWKHSFTSAPLQLSAVQCYLSCWEIALLCILKVWCSSQMGSVPWDYTFIHNWKKLMFSTEMKDVQCGLIAVTLHYRSVRSLMVRCLTWMFIQETTPRVTLMSGREKHQPAAESFTAVITVEQGRDSFSSILSGYISRPSFLKWLSLPGSWDGPANLIRHVLFIIRKLMCKWLLGISCFLLLYYG